MTIHCSCESCNSEFDLRYEEDDVEDSPGYCPFCGEKIFLDEEEEFDVFRAETELDDSMDL